MQIALIHIALPKIDQRDKEITPQANLDKEYADYHNL